jgi:acyl-CoA reductase-like NAD-dependent aldehyde dehydrogenase
METAKNAIDWKKRAAAVRWQPLPFINGRYRGSDSPDLIEDINPATETALCRYPAGSSTDVAEAVRVARKRFNDGCWSELPPARRSKVLSTLADLIARQGEELGLLDTLEVGKPIRDALDDAGRFAPALLRSWAEYADKLLGECDSRGVRGLAFNTYEPRGVVGAITPWNFPLVNAVIKCGPALAAGNSVVLKPSELCPSSALRLAELALEAGLPEGVLNVVPGVGSTVGVALAQHPDVDLVSFTGSTKTGRRIMELSGRSNAKPLLLECGGKSPHVVFSDVLDLDNIADAVAQSILWNQGQVCSAHTRLLVHESMKEALLGKVIQRASQYEPSDPLCEKTTFGPVASPTQRSRIKQYIEDGLRAGAVALLRGRIQETAGCYVAPTIFDRVNSDMSIVREEIFGPVLCVQGFNNEEEAVALANATDYGLSATVWTRDMGRGVRLARSIKAGQISVRTAGKEDAEWVGTLSSEPRKASGFGAEIGLQGLRSYSTLKSVCFRGD